MRSIYIQRESSGGLLIKPNEKVEKEVKRNTFGGVMQMDDKECDVLRIAKSLVKTDQNIVSSV